MSLISDSGACDTHSIDDKLMLDDGMVRLPNPVSISNWEMDPVDLPTITKDCVENYFTKANNELGVYSKNCEALKLGKGLYLSKHVGDILYSAISANLMYAFVKTTCVRQTCLRDDPYNLWIIIHKNFGTINGAYCACVGGITGCCKHVAALLYSLIEYTSS